MLGWESYDGVTDCKYNECCKCRECRDLQQLALVVFSFLQLAQTLYLHSGCYSRQLALVALFIEALAHILHAQIRCLRAVGTQNRLETLSRSRNPQIPRRPWRLHTVPGNGCQRKACAAALSSCRPLQGDL